MDNAKQVTLSGRMRMAALEMSRDAGRLGRRGNYRLACDQLRLSDLLRELACQVDAWEARQAKALKVPSPGVQDPAMAGIDDKAGIDE